MVAHPAEDPNAPPEEPKTKEKQALGEIDEVKGIMHQNLQKMQERGEKLDTLNKQTGKPLLLLLLFLSDPTRSVVYAVIRSLIPNVRVFCW